VYDRESRERVLCVDDEPMVLRYLTDVLRREFTPVTAASGTAGLEVIRTNGPFAVIVSDMRMPGLDGAEFLRQARQLTPDSTRMILTAYADVDSAIAAVNDGNVFRFLTKPCRPQDLIAAVRAAVEQNRLVTSERVLLEQTLRGSVQALIDVLALISPISFGRAVRAKQLIGELARLSGVADQWVVEVAAMLSQIGTITLPVPLVERLYAGERLEPDEEVLVRRLPQVAQQILSDIPRLEAVIQIISYMDKRYDGSGPVVSGPRGDALPWGARALKIILDYDVLETQGFSRSIALDTMRGRIGWYDPQILQTFAAQLGSPNQVFRVLEIGLNDVRPGMIFAADVRTRSGTLLIARGQEVTTGLAERIRNFPRSLSVNETVRVIDPTAR
jgi:response regulator RpfG family c-di-GMP phosphodiesterase